MAGPAVAAIAFQAVQTVIKDIVNTLQSGFDKLKTTVISTVETFRPFEVEMFGRALKDLRAVFGQMFLPILQTMTRVVREVASYFYSLPASFKEAIAAFVKIGLVIGAIAVVAITIAGVVGTLMMFTGIAQGLIAVVGILTYAFSQTSGGARFLANALRFVEQVIAGVQEAAMKVWHEIAPLRQQLSEAFSELGDAWSELLEAMKPLIAGGIAAAAKTFALSLKIVLNALVEAVRFTSWMVQNLARLMPILNLLPKGFQLPNLDREKKDAFGLGQHGGTVTDPLSAFKMMQEEIMKNVGMEAKADPIKEVADNTKEIAKDMAAVKEAIVDKGIFDKINRVIDQLVKDARVVMGR